MLHLYKYVSFLLALYIDQFLVNVSLKFVAYIAAILFNLIL